MAGSRLVMSEPLSRQHRFALHVDVLQLLSRLQVTAPLSVEMTVNLQVEKRAMKHTSYRSFALR